MVSELVVVFVLLIHLYSPPSLLFVVPIPVRFSQLHVDGYYYEKTYCFSCFDLLFRDFCPREDTVSRASGFSEPLTVTLSTARDHTAYPTLLCIFQMRTVPRSTRRTLVGKENLAKHGQSQRDSVPATSGKKARHRLSTAELARLEDVFRQETHPSRQRKKDLAAELGM